MKLLGNLFISVIAMLILATAFPVTSSAAIQWTPKENSVPSNKEWKITFNQSVDTNTISNNTIYVLNDNGDKQAIIPRQSASNSREIIVPSPKTGYLIGNNYTLYIEKSLKSTKGKTLTDGIEMKFTIENTNIKQIVLGTWNGEYLGISFHAVFHNDFSSLVTLDEQEERGIYSILGSNMTMTLLGNTRTGRVDQISPNEFTITSASGKVIRFTK